MQHVERLHVGQRPPVGTVGRQRVEAVHHREDPRADRDRRSGESRRVPVAVPVLVVVAHDRHHRVGEVDRREDVRADARVPLDLLELRGVSRAGLLRMCSGIASLPTSCSSAAASIAFTCDGSLTPSALARPTAQVCTRLMCPWVIWSVASTAMASVSMVDR